MTTNNSNTMAHQANPYPYPMAMSFSSIQTDRPFLGQGFRFNHSPGTAASAYAYGYGYANAYGCRLTGGVNEAYPAYNLSSAAEHYSPVSEAKLTASETATPDLQSPVAVSSQSKEIYEGPCEEVRCMLHDLGQDCDACGDLPKASKTIKFGGKVKESLRQDISSASESVFDGIAFGGNTFHGNTSGGWIPGLGHPRPESHPAVMKPKATEICDSCGTDAATRKKYGPGHCVGCRYRWLDDYREEQARAAGIMTMMMPMTMSVRATSKFDWLELGYDRS